MASNTSKGITYPTSGDAISPLETVFATMASTTNTALSNINASTDIASGTLPIARGGTGGTTQATAATALGVVPTSSYSVAGKNAIINGAFDVWQRATTSTSTSATGYFADRWRYAATGGAGKVLTQSRQTFTLGAAPVAGYEGRFYYRIAITTAGSGYAYEAIEQPIEDVRTFAGSTVTVSFWARTAAGTVSSTPRLQQDFGTGGSPSATVVTAGTAVSITTAWQRFSQTITVPSITGKTIGTNNDSSLVLALTLPGNGTYSVDLWGVQVEQGPSATMFTRAGGNIGGEILLTQRYYYRIDNTSGATSYFANGMQFSGTSTYAYIKFPEEMRAAPTALETAGTINVVTTSGRDSTSTVFGSANIDGAYIQCTTAASTSGFAAMLRFTGTAGTAYVGFSAEL
jgi:hypothetical protein